MLYTIIIYFGNLKGLDYHKKNYNIPCYINGPNQAHWQAFIYLSCIVTYTVITCILTVVMGFFCCFSYDLFTCIVFIILLSAPWCRCWHLSHTTASLSDPADKLKASFFFFFFLYIRSVLDCNLSCFIVNKTIFSQT